MWEKKFLKECADAMVYSKLWYLMERFAHDIFNCFFFSYNFAYLDSIFTYICGRGSSWQYASISSYHVMAPHLWQVINYRDWPWLGGLNVFMRHQATIRSLVCDDLICCMNTLISRQKNLTPVVELTIKRHWFRKWLGTKQAPSHHRIQSWLSLLT